MGRSLTEEYNDQFRQGHFDHDHPSDDVRHLEATLPRGATVLDLGCGTGADCAFLAAQGHHVNGIDISDVAIDLARAKWKNYLINFRQGQAEAIPFPESTFDAVCSMGMLQRTNLELSLPEIARVLKPNGSFLLFFFLEVEYEDEAQSERNFKLDDAKAFELIDTLFLERSRKSDRFPGDDGFGKHWHKSLTLSLTKKT